MMDRTIATQFLNKLVKIETDSENFNYFKGTVRKVTERSLILEFLTGKIMAFDLQEICTIREVE
jgi:hypothetical protein